MVRRLESGRIGSMGLQLDELLQVEPDEQLLERLEAEADELAGLRRWLARLRADGPGSGGPAPAHPPRGPAAALTAAMLLALLPELGLVGRHRAGRRAAGIISQPTFFFRSRKQVPSNRRRR